MSPVTGRKSSFARARSASSCQGTMLLWCSISVSRILSPALMWFRTPGLRDEVDAFGSAAGEDDFFRIAGVEERRRRARGRLRRAAVARLLNSWMPRWTLALFVFVVMNQRIEQPRGASGSSRRYPN